MARLVVEAGADKGMVYPLTQPVSTMGRSVSNTIQIIDRRMSRHHAEILLENNEFLLKDLGSRNGTYLNEQRVEGTIALNNGDRIRVGETVVVFELGAGTEKEARPGDTTTKSLRLVDEKQWGRMTGKVRAGADPHLGVKVEAGEGEILKDSHRRLEILYQVADAIRSVLAYEELLGRIVDIIFSVVQPDRAYILLYDQSGNKDLIPQVVKRRDGLVEDEIQISGSIVQKCIHDKSALLVTDAASDQRFSASESIVLNRIRSAMCAPLIFKNEVLGVVYVDTQSRIVSYSKEELELLTGIANQSAIAIVNARLHGQLIEQHKLAREMEIARSIQMNLLPKTYPALEGYEISAMSLPAKKVGGDYYDFYQLSHGRVGFTIADVSGKGLPAAFLTTLTRTYLRCECQRPDIPVRELVAKINQQVYGDVSNDMYVTMVFGVLEPAAGKFTYVNAGHVYPLLFSSRKGEIKRLDRGGTFLGILEEVEYEEGQATLRPGDTLLLYTDGVTDVHNAENVPWGHEKLEQLVLNNLSLGAEELRNAIFQACHDYKGEVDLFDDFTLIVMKRTMDNKSITQDN